MNPLTVVLADAAVRIRGNGISSSLQDVDGDGDLDLLVKIETDQMNLTDGAVLVELRAETFDGVPLVGFDSVTIVP